MKIEHNFACQMLLRATCWRNKLNLLNSNRKMVTVDPLISDHRSPLTGSTDEAIAFSHESENCLLILSALIIDPPRINCVDHLFMQK